jgi:hypothetical protein
MRNSAMAATVAIAAAAAMTLGGCSAGPAPVAHPKTAADITRRTAGSTDAVAVPARLPRVLAVGSRALCSHVPALTQLEVVRVSSLPQDHITFTFPARLVVASRASARAVARILCGLPTDTIVNCPADFGVSYWLYFSPARLHLTPAVADAAGCLDIAGLGRPARWGLPRFWRELGTAMGVLRPGQSQAAMYRLFGGRLPGA